MTEHYKETGVLKVEVGIHIYERIIAHLGAVITVLHSELTERSTVRRCVVAREIACIGTEVSLQHMRYL